MLPARFGCRHTPPWTWHEQTWPEAAVYGPPEWRVLDSWRVLDWASPAKSRCGAAEPLRRPSIRPSPPPSPQSKRVTAAAILRHPWLKGPLATELQEAAWRAVEAEAAERSSAWNPPTAAAQVGRAARVLGRCVWGVWVGVSLGARDTASKLSPENKAKHNNEATKQNQHRS